MTGVDPERGKYPIVLDEELVRAEIGVSIGEKKELPILSADIGGGVGI